MGQRSEIGLEERRKKMAKFTLAVLAAVMLLGTPAFAQMGDQPREPGTVNMPNSGYQQKEMSVVGRITDIDLSQGTLTLDDGTQITLPPSFQYTSAPMLGQRVEVTYDEQDGHKIARSVDAGFEGPSSE
jgi:uncharacterized protein DUF1344